MRSITLRRPAILAVVDGPFVPEGGRSVLAAIERRWETLCRANSAFFDGRLYHVLAVHRNGCGGATLHVAECAYRYHAVQDDGFDLGVRALGVKGLTHRGDRLLVGRRADHVAAYPGRWEFAPGGVVEPAAAPERAAPETVLAELAEETGVRPARPPVEVALLEDGRQRCWEIVYRIDAATAGEARSDEYPEIAWRGLGELPDDLTPVGRRMIPLARAIFDA